MNDKNEIVVLRTYSSFPEADLDRQTLEKSGITGYINDDSFTTIMTGQTLEYRLSVSRTEKLKAEKCLGLNP